MALTKEKLISRLQTQVGLSKQESRSVVERVLDIMKESLAKNEDLLISGFGKFSVRQKNARRGPQPADQGKSDPPGPPSSGVQDLRGVTQPHQRRLVLSNFSSTPAAPLQGLGAALSPDLLPWGPAPI